MKTFYSIIKIASNPTAGDNLSIGLLLQDKNGFRLLFSEEKKRFAKHLVKDNPEVVDFVVKQIESKVKEVNSAIKSQRNTLIEIPTLLNSEYFDYLSKYCNGVLQFSSASVIDDNVDSSKFNQLFELLIDKLPTNIVSTKEKINRFNSIIESKLIDRVRGKVHTHIKLDNKQINSLFFQIEIDCIGLNGEFVGAKSLDFTRNSSTLDTQISHYTNLITFLSLDKKKDILKSKFFLIAEEPIKIDSPEHKIWDGIHKQNVFRIINPDESDKVAKIVEDTKAKMFLAI